MRRLLLGAVGLCAGLAAGCGPAGPEVSEVRGRVTLDGKPVAAGRVMLLAADDSNAASGELGPDGTYAIVGGPAGPVRVAIEVEPYRLAPNMGSPTRKKAKDGGSAENVPDEVAGGWKKNPRYVPIPERYTQFDTSGLTATVTPGQHELNLELTAK